MSFVPLIVGSIFFALGLNMALHFYRFRKSATRIYGRVMAIEKYVSETRMDGRRTSQVFFRPIVEYVLDGETRKTTGSSVNEIRHKLEQTVPVLIRRSEDGQQVQAILDDGLSALIGYLIAFAGLGALGVYVFHADGSIIAAAVLPAALAAIGFGISSAFLKFKGFLGAIQKDSTPHKNAEIIDTAEAYRKEVSSHGFWGAIIAFSFMALSLAIVFFGYSGLPADAREMMNNDFGAFWTQLTSGKMPSSWTDKLLLLGIGLFFFLASLRSVYYVRKKYGALLTR
jgi:hypothetical protein